MQQLFTGEELGDRKPTQLLCKWNNYWEIVKELTLPSSDNSSYRSYHLMYIRIVLALTPDGTNLNSLAETADNIVEVAGPFVAPV